MPTAATLLVPARFDPHQLAASLAGFAAVRHMPPAAVHLATSRLAANGGAAVAKLHTAEVAVVAEALAVAQGLQREQEAQLQAMASAAAATQQQQQQHQPQGAAGGEAALLQQLVLTAAAGAQPQPQQPQQLPGAANASDGMLAAASAPLTAGGQVKGGAQLALRPPLEQVWQLLEARVVSEAHNFTVPALVSAAWAFARSGRAGSNGRFLAAVERSVLLRPQKVEAADAALLARAVAAAGDARSPLLPLLGDLSVTFKGTLSYRQLAGMLSAFSSLGYYHPGACLAACKMLSGRPAAWDPSDVLLLLRALAALRHADAPAMAAAAKVLAPAAPGLPAGQLVGALSSLLWLGAPRDAAFDGLLAACQRWGRAALRRPLHLRTLLLLPEG